MGGCLEKGFEPNKAIIGQGDEVLETARVFGLDRHDLDVLFRYFNKCNISHTGHLRIEEFLVNSGIDRSEGMALFGEIIFRLFDGLNDRRLTFHELVLALYFFLTQERDLLELFAFQLFDADDSGVMTSEEISFMVSLIWGHRSTTTYSKNYHKKTVTHDKHVRDALKLLDADMSGDVSLEEFLLYCKRAPIILFPVFEVQATLRDLTLGRSRWEFLSEYRETRTRKRNKAFAQVTAHVCGPLNCCY